MTVILGPCPCSVCGDWLYWNGLAWRTAWGDPHACPSRTNVRNDLAPSGLNSYDSVVGSGDGSASIAPALGSWATTPEPGVAASIEVVAR